MSWLDMPSHLLSAFIGMVPVLMAEQTMTQVDALALMSEYTSKEDRAGINRRLQAVMKGKLPNGGRRQGPDDNLDNYPGAKLYGAAQVRQWFNVAGGFKAGQIQE